MDAKDRDVALYAPLKPQDARATFPAYAELPPDLRRVLEATDGQPFYQALGDQNKAGLLNIFVKMDRLGVWEWVERLNSVAPDRLFADISQAIWLRVPIDERYRWVDSSLHQPPPEYTAIGSWKTLERAGNLQLTFFGPDDELDIDKPLKLDADIDDAAGIGHVFQVLGHALTNGVTHPYDIHEILVFRQELVLPYSLA
jgi:hypothetical protein